MTLATNNGVQMFLTMNQLVAKVSIALILAQQMSEAN
jgi:hypothetical protein